MPVRRSSPPAEAPAESAPSAEPALSLLEAAVKERPAGPPQPPVIRVTRYELVTTFLIALLVAVGLTVASLTMQYLATRPKQPDAVAPIEMIELPGGAEDGSIEETLRVESPYEERADASVVDAPTDQLSQVEETLDNVLELSDAATNQAQQQFLLDVQSTGRKGSASGTGRRALGMGPGRSGMPRDQRWFISFSDRVSLPEYAKQLDFFGIELGAVFPDRIVYLSQMSGQPKTRTVNTGKGETRLYMNWQGGTRRQADQELFKAAGVDPENALILHFYPPQTEALLAKLERDYAKRPVDQIKRTYFVVNRLDKGYEFEVTRQAYFQ